MGTSLTGLTPATTYDALIKVGDNGPLSATAKVLSDGLGNDSVLALSTTAVGVGTSTPLSIFHVKTGTNGNLRIRQGTEVGAVDGACINTRSDDDSVLQQLTLRASDVLMLTSGGVGIGTSTPAAKLDVDGNINISASGNLFTAATSGVFLNGVGSFSTGVYNNGTGNVIFNANGAERARITANGLTFNGDTAAANALDDYEEGTWTMGVSFGGASVGVTTSANTGTYTKIGRQVTVNGYIVLTSKGSSTGIAFLTGLPFTVANTSGNFGAAPVWFNNINFLNQFQGRFNQNQNYIELEEITNLGVASNLTDADFANNSGIMVSATYFV